MDALFQDFRYALRHLRHSPGFAASAILILALGVGANTGMFSILNGLMLRPLPVNDPDGLVGIQAFGANGGRRGMLVPLAELLEQTESPFTRACAINGGGVFAVEANGIPLQGSMATVTGSCFDVFGVQPLWGRTIGPADAPVRGRGNPVTVISHRFWSRTFGTDPNAIGKTIRSEGVDLTVVGVMPEGFVGLQADASTDFFVPNYTVTPMRTDRPASSPQIIGRLKSGVTLEAAQAELSARWPALIADVTPSTLAAAERANFLDQQPRLESLSRGLNFYRDRYGRSLTIILGLTVVLLLLACINLGGLLLARLNERSAELSVRLALGSSGFRLGQQMLLESLVLSVSGAALAVPLSFGFVGLLSSLLPTPMIAHTLDFSPDGKVLLTTSAIGVASGVAMSALPMLLTWRRRARLLSASDRTVVGATSRWARGMLIVQVALSMILLSGAALLIRSLYLLQNVATGVQADQVVYLKLMPVPGGYRGIDNASYYRGLLDQVATLPAVRSAGFSRLFPRAGDLVGLPIGLAGDPTPQLVAQKESVSPGLFETLGVPLLSGRYPQWTDTATSHKVAVVNESLARMLVADGNILGRRVNYGADPADRDVEIVGIVADTTLGSLRLLHYPVFFRPMLQAGLFGNYPNLLVKVDGDPLTAIAGMAAIVKQQGREYAHQSDKLEDVFKRSPSNERMSATLAGVIALLAVTLAFVGIYSLLAYSVARRAREIGLRVALGAGRGEVVRMVMRDGLVLTGVGVAIGVPAALAGSGVLRTMLYGVSSADPLVLAASVVFFLALGLAAGIVPARRAASVDPAVALRNE
jgi:putative ABC transport system permease protein